MSGLGIKLTGDWTKAMSIVQTMDTRFQRATDQAVLKEAHFLRGKMVQNLTSGGTLAGKPFLPLSPSTLIIRQFQGFGGSKPLLVTGALRNSIAVVKVAGGVFVGVKRSGKGAKGGVNLAELHEYGGGPYSRPMTPRQRRFLFAAFRNSGASRPGTGGGGMLTIRIPARPFIGPVVEKFGQPEDVRKRFWAHVSRGMGYDLGRA